MLQQAIDPLGDIAHFQYKIHPLKYIEVALRMISSVLPKQFSNTPANLVM